MPETNRQRKIRLSILDQSPVMEGGTAAEAFNDTLRLARLSEGWGYFRYWVAEHHGIDGLAGCSPEVLLARMGGETTNLRIGSGGVMLPHYSPYKVAENFKVLATLYPGRIDLGVGKSPRIRRYVADALSYGAGNRERHFPRMLRDLAAFIHDSPPVTERIASARTLPHVGQPPEMWLLGTSTDSASLAAQLGLPYCYGLFIKPDIPREIFGEYQKQFQSSSQATLPRSMLCVFVICAETEAKAKRLAASRDLWFLRRTATRSLQPRVPGLDEAVNYDQSRLLYSAVWNT